LACVDDDVRYERPVEEGRIAKVCICRLSRSAVIHCRPKISITVAHLYDGRVIAVDGDRRRDGRRRGGILRRWKGRGDLALRSGRGLVAAALRGQQGGELGFSQADGGRVVRSVSDTKFAGVYLPEVSGNGCENLRCYGLGEAGNALLWALNIGVEGLNSGDDRGDDEAASELDARGVENLLPYRDLWDWYGRWSSGDLPTWQSRREFVNNIFNQQVRYVRAKRDSSLQVAVAPTGWERVDRDITEVRKRLESASTEAQFQAVGLLCREALISLAQAVYDPATHPTLDGTNASDTDAKRMLEAYIAVALSGSANEQIRKHARAAVDLAVHLQHRRTATYRDAAVCTEATTSVVNLVAIVAGKRNP
jgi:hypothetical protein